MLNPWEVDLDFKSALWREGLVIGSASGLPSRRLKVLELAEPSLALLQVNASVPILVLSTAGFPVGVD